MKQELYWTAMTILEVVLETHTCGKGPQLVATVYHYVAIVESLYSGHFCKAATSLFQPPTYQVTYDIMVYICISFKPL